MRRRLATAAIFIFGASMLGALLAGGALSSTGDDSGDTATASVKRCGKVNIGFTDARIRAKQVRCGRAREVFATWLNKAEEQCNKGVCPMIEAEGFTCRKGGNELLIKVRCARPVNKVVVARWGD